MRITDGRGANVERPVARHQILAQNFAARAAHRNFVAPKTDAPHVHADRAAVLKDRRTHHAAQRLHEELFVLLHKFLNEEVTTENAQAVAALLRLAAIGVENAQPKRRALRSERAVENSIRTHAEVAMA